MSGNCARLKNIEALIEAGEMSHVSDITWMVQQLRGWQKFAKRVVDYGDRIGRLRTVTVSDPQVASDILDGYDQLFKVRDGN